MDLVTLFATIEDSAQLVVERREESLIVEAAFELISTPRASFLAHSLRSKQVCVKALLVEEETDVAKNRVPLNC